MQLKDVFCINSIVFISFYELYLIERIEQVGEEDDMDLGGEVELLPEAFEDAAEEIGRVEAGQGHQQLK